MAGRKKIPEELKKLRGTKRKDRDNPKKPTNSLYAAGCPYPLFGVALETWNQLSQELTKIKVLTEADLQALKLLCEAIAEYDSLLLRVWEDRPNGKREYVPTVNLYEIYEKGKGKMKLSIPTLIGIRTKPEVAMLAENRKFQKAMLEQFGLTPSSRMKVWTIGSPPPGPEKSKLQMMREKRAARKAARNEAS